MAYNPNLRRNKYGGYFLIKDVVEDESNIGKDRITYGSGTYDLRNHILFETEGANDEYRREKAQQQREEWEQRERQIAKNEEQAKMADSQDTKKHRRVAMKESYTAGDHIHLADGDYTVQAVKYIKGKLDGYVVTDANGKTWFINRFGEKGEF